MSAQKRLRLRRWLNLTGYHSTAFIAANIGGTHTYTYEPDDPDQPPETSIGMASGTITISDCGKQISLSFEGDTPGERRNTLRKLDTLIDVLTRVRGFLIDEWNQT